MTIKRRDFFQLAIWSGLSGLSGCTYNLNNPILKGTSETLPKKLIGSLPSPWRFKTIETSLTNDFLSSQLLNKIDLLAVGDGWLNELPVKSLKPINAHKLKPLLGRQTKNFLASLDSELSEKVFPIGVTPWVMLFRNGAQWASKAKAGWDVLLEPDLQGKVILPNSPRIVMSLAKNMQKANALSRLVQQARIFDDRNGLNWLLNGQGRVAILPLQRCMQIWRRDHRLSVFLPDIGAPLNWTVLVRPKSSRNDLPQLWLENAWSLPLMSQLLGEGFIPPIRLSEIKKSNKDIPLRYRSIVVLPETVWNRCWSLPPLKKSEQMSLHKIWRNSIP